MIGRPGVGEWIWQSKVRDNSSVFSSLKCCPGGQCQLAMGVIIQSVSGVECAVNLQRHFSIFFCSL